MKNIKDLGIFLEEKMYPACKSDWDQDGIMCSPDLEKPIRKILLVLDITDFVVDYAIENHFDVVISHHPLIFHPLYKITKENFVVRKCLRLMEQGISAMSYHTRLDSSEGGVNDRLADLIGLSNCEKFGLPGEMMGRIGRISPCDLPTFVSLVKDRLFSPFVQVIDGHRDVSKVALLGGSGKDFLQAAVDSGADTYLTGEMNYNSLVDASSLGINVITAGHFYTEYPVLEVLKKWIQEWDSSLDCQLLFCPTVKYL
jgi:dinuclear metal center YbgI/SA1388 family protein